MDARAFFTYTAMMRDYQQKVADYYQRKRNGSTDAGDEVRIRGYLDAKHKYEAMIDSEINRYRELSGNAKFGTTEGGSHE